MTPHAAPARPGTTFCVHCGSRLRPGVAGDGVEATGGAVGVQDRATVGSLLCPRGC